LNRREHFTKKDEVVLVWNWIQRVYVSPYTPPHFEQILKKAVDLALIYHGKVNEEGMNRLRRKLTKEMITRSVRGLAHTALLYFVLLFFYTKGSLWRDGSLYAFGTLFLVLSATIAAPFIYTIHRTIHTSLSSVATPLSNPLLLRRLRHTYDSLAQNNRQEVVNQDSKESLWQPSKTRHKIPDWCITYAKWAAGIVLGIVLLISVWAGIAGNSSFAILVLKLLSSVWMIAVVVRCLLIVRTILSADVSASTRMFFEERLSNIALSSYRVAVSLITILILSHMPADLFAQALFVAMSCVAVAASNLEVLHYTLRFTIEYAVQVDETTELLYGLMTDRKIKVAKAIIKEIIKDSENLSILGPEQLKEEILTLETALSRILLNRAVYRHAQSAQKRHI